VDVITYRPLCTMLRPQVRESVMVRRSCKRLPLVASVGVGRQRSQYVLLVCILAVGAVMRVDAEPIDQHTSELLKAIIAGERDNRRRVFDLEVKGIVQTARSTGNEEISFSYCELGEKMRVDATYPKASPREGLTYRWVLRGNRSLSYIPETGSTRIMYPVEFQMQSPLTYLDTLVVSGQWRTHTEHIEYLLQRGWQPDKESIVVVDESTEEGEVFLHVQYTSTRGGGTTKHEWFFAPERGYQVVEASASVSYRGGNPLSNTHSRYDVTEVAPGAWRAVGVDMESDDWDRDGQRTTVHRHIEPLAVAANTGRVQEGDFTLAGLGLKAGTLVTDFTFKPPLVYEYMAESLSDMEVRLDATLDASEKVAGGTKPESQVSRARREAASPMPGESNSGVTSGSLRGSQWRILLLWSSLLFAIGLIVAYVAMRLRRRALR